MSKVVVITGANSGIGLAAAKLYESNGYFVVLGCRDEKKGLSTEKEIGKRSKFLKIDMTDYESINNFYNNLKAEFDEVDIFCAFSFPTFSFHSSIPFLEIIS